MPVEPFSASDALVWRIEADPVLRSPILVVGLLDRAPVWERVVAAWERAAEAAPGFRRRIATVRGRPAWVDDDRFTVLHHLRRVRAPEGGDVGAALAMAQQEATDAFEPARPPWTFVLVEGLDGGHAAFALRFHHAISDGVGAVQLAEHLFERTRRTDTGATSEPPWPLPPSPGPMPFDRALALVRSGVRQALDPVGTVRQGIRFGRSLGRLLAPAPTPLSPLFRDRSLERSLRVVDVPMAELEDLAARAGGTINDAFLAGVGGALRSYHDALGAGTAALRFTVPVSLRRDGDPEGGNRFAPVRFVLPIDDPDPVHRARLAGGLVRSWRREPALPAADLIASALDLLPTGVVVKLFGSMLRSTDVDAVDVPGLQHPAYLGGARVDRLWAFAPPTGAALSATLLSHAGTACIGLATDDAAVTDPDLLARLLRSSLGSGRTTADGPEVAA
jgi:WS/DGAT/MGAT family acyltransferase